MSKLLQTLDQQHPVHSLLGRMYERAGGDERFEKWLEDDRNFGRLITLLVKTAPPLVPSHGMSGDVNITVHPALQKKTYDQDGNEEPL